MWRVKEEGNVKNKKHRDQKISDLRYAESKHTVHQYTSYIGNKIFMAAINKDSIYVIAGQDWAGMWGWRVACSLTAAVHIDKTFSQSAALSCSACLNMKKERNLSHRKSRDGPTVESTTVRSVVFLFLIQFSILRYNVITLTIEWQILFNVNNN